jgi:hypothetical protein
MSETRVVNKYAEHFDVYIGRGSKWGNPFTHRESTYPGVVRVGSPEAAIGMYREWIMRQPQLLNALDELRGKVLGCYCKPAACHGDVLAELADA